MEELNQALATLIEQVTTGVDASVAFLQVELPDVIYQLILWHGLKSGIFFVLGLLLMIIPLTIYIRILCDGFKPIEYEDDHKFRIGDKITKFLKVDYLRGEGDFTTDFTTVGGITTFVGGLLTLGLTIFGLALLNIEWLQILVAPKVWLIEYAANLVM